MGKRQLQQIVLTHWNAGVFRTPMLPNLLPELAVYCLLYDEVLIREEDLLTNRAITTLLDEDANFTIFAELLVSGFVRLLRLPFDQYPAGRRFDPIRLPISARAEEHQMRRSYKGKRWTPSSREWMLFRRLDEVVADYPSASRHHLPFDRGNPFAAQLAEILGNREAYRIAAHPVFRYLDGRTADQFIEFCQDPEAWIRFVRDRGLKQPIVGPDAGFYRSAAYQCSVFLPTRRAIRRLVESVYAATYCDRESADGRYGGGGELVELPYRFGSEAERSAAADEGLRIEIVPTDIVAELHLAPGLAAVLARTRESAQFAEVRRATDSLRNAAESPLLAEARFRDAWHSLCAVYAENAAVAQLKNAVADHRVVRYTIWLYILARVLGMVVMPSELFEVAEDALAIAAIEKLGPRMLQNTRASLRMPKLQRSMERAAAVRCSSVPLTIQHV